MAEKRRIDALLVERGFFPTREKARRAILAGEVLANGRLVDKPGTTVQTQASLFVKRHPAYVSRGGEKLDHALRVFGVDPRGLVALDAGAGTGGFTEVLLKYGAEKVYAVDVGYGVLDWRLRENPRVVVLERTNVRYLEPDRLGEQVDLITADLSFISLNKVLPAFLGLSKAKATLVLLVKPEFEAGPDKVAKGGLVKEAKVHREVLLDLYQAFEKAGLAVRGLTYSPIKGADGNIEFFAHLRRGAEEQKSRSAEGLGALVERVVEEAHRNAK